MWPGESYSLFIYFFYLCTVIKAESIYTINAGYITDYIDDKEWQKDENKPDDSPGKRFSRSFDFLLITTWGYEFEPGINDKYQCYDTAGYQSESYDIWEDDRNALQCSYACIWNTISPILSEHKSKKLIGKRDIHKWRISHES